MHFLEQIECQPKTYYFESKNHLQNPICGVLKPTLVGLATFSGGPPPKAGSSGSPLGPCSDSNGWVTWTPKDVYMLLLLLLLVVVGFLTHKFPRPWFRPWFRRSFNLWIWRSPVASSRRVLKIPQNAWSKAPWLGGWNTNGVPPSVIHPLLDGICPLLNHDLGKVHISKPWSSCLPSSWWSPVLGVQEFHCSRVDKDFDGMVEPQIQGTMFSRPHVPIEIATTLSPFK